MKISSIVFTAGVTVFSATAIAGPGGHDHAPKYGGIVIEVKDVDYEVVAKSDVIQIYARDHGKAVKMDGGKAKVTLLNGNEKVEVDLTPAGDKLEAKGSFKVAKGTKGVAMVTLSGKTNAVRFEIR
jgi:hypothetical protein